MDRRVQEDGTVIVGGQVVPTGGAQPTTATVVSYNGSAGLQSTNVEAALDELDTEKAPVVHTHTIANVTGLQTALDGKAPTSHNHDDRYYTEVEVTSLLASKSDTTHTHDGRYYTETEVDTLLAGKAPTSHTHTISNVTGLQTALDGKAATSHTHTIANVTGLQTALDGKSDTSHTHDTRYYTETEVDNLLAGKSPNSHIHDDRYFTEVEVTNLLAGKANTSHTHVINDVTGLQTALNNKADTSHSHDDLYYTETQVDSMLSSKSNNGHIHDDRYYTESEVDTKISDALSSTNLHQNSNFDSVELSTGGPFGTTVPERLRPVGWDMYWTGGGTPYADVRSDPTVTKTGSGYSVKINFSTATRSQDLTSTTFAVVPGSLIQVETWVRGNGPRGFITILSNATGSPDWFVSGTNNSDGPQVQPDSTWQKMVHSYIVPADHIYGRIKFRSNSSAPASPGDIWWDESSSKMTVTPPSGVVTGEIKMWPTGTAPSGYLLCNGGTFSATTYPALAALLGDTFGTHSGDTYYLPDFRGRAPVGAGAASPAVGGRVWTIGNKHGDERLQAHTHSGTTGTDSPDHTHTVSEIAHATNAQFSVAGGTGMDNPTWWTRTTSGASARHTHTFTTGAHNQSQGSAGNFQPSLGINYIIKAA